MIKGETAPIYIEGTDLVGKDVVGEVIRGKYGISNVQKLSLHDNNPWDADRTKELPSGHPLFPAFLIRSIIWDIRQYQPQKETDRLQISFTASRSAAWTAASKDGLADVFKELLKYSPRFRNTFLLSASLEVKRNRLQERLNHHGNVSEIDSLVFTKPEFVESMDSHLKQMMSEEMGASHVDTSNLTVSQVGDILVASIDKDKITVSHPKAGSVQLDITPELDRFHKEIVAFSMKVIAQNGLSEEYLNRLTKPFITPINKK